MPFPSPEQIEELRHKLHWTREELSYLLLAKQVRRAESGRPFCAYLLQHSQTLANGAQDPQDSFHRFLDFVKKNVDRFENNSCMQMLVYDGKLHWTNFSIVIKDSKILVFACDSADDTPGETAIVEMQKILGDQAKIYYKLQPDILTAAERQRDSEGNIMIPTRVIQTGNFECSRMAVYNSGLLSKAGAELFEQFEEQGQLERYETLLESNLELRRLGAEVSVEQSLDQIRLIKPQVAVQLLPALYGVTQSWTRLDGIADIPEQEVGNSGRTLREWANAHSEERIVHGRSRPINLAIKDKSNKMVDHLAELCLEHTPEELAQLVVIMQDWTQSAPLKGRAHPIQPPQAVIEARISAKDVADRKKHIQVLQEKVTLFLEEQISRCSKQILDLEQRELERSTLSKILTCCIPGLGIAEQIDELQCLRAALEAFKSGLNKIPPEQLEKNLLALLKIEKLPHPILVALQRVVAKYDLYAQQGKLPAASFFSRDQSRRDNSGLVVDDSSEPAP
jgi:hypothetical protein